MYTFIKKATIRISFSKYEWPVLNLFLCHTDLEKWLGLHLGLGLKCFQMFYRFNIAQKHYKTKQKRKMLYGLPALAACLYSGEGATRPLRCLHVDKKIYFFHNGGFSFVFICFGHLGITNRSTWISWELAKVYFWISLVTRAVILTMPTFLTCPYPMLYQFLQF